jgi:hypothetical protein
MIEQFHKLTDNARHFISNNDFHNFYAKNIDLDYSMIFQNPLLFIEKLFVLLDELDLSYTRDVEYCLSSISLYRKTCVNPMDHYGNYQSLVWLAWCHALCLTNNIEINESLDESKSLTELSDIFDHCQFNFFEKTKPYMFEWKD